MKILNNFPYSHVLVLGLAKSGKAAAELLLNSNIQTRVNDLSADEEDTTVQELEALGAEVITGSHPLSVLDGIDLLVKNPGIPYENIIVTEAGKRNIPIVTEVELACQLMDHSMIAITGSNGKTTTTTLITEMLKESEVAVQIAGNIGNVATEVARDMTDEEIMVIELSSFQLLGAPSLSPKVAVLLNLYEAHLDYHQSIEHYQAAKLNIFKNQTEKDYLIYNAEDPVVKEAVFKKAHATLVPFSTKQRLKNGLWADKDYLYFKDEKIMTRKDILLVGEHNLENILAALGAALLSGANKIGIRKVLRSFSGVKHRLEFIGTIHERIFYNDSKSTNLLATQKALSAFKDPLILLAGGLDRGDDFSTLIPYFSHVKALVVFGQTAEKLREAGENAGIETIKVTKNIQEATKKAYKLSKAGDVILLSPACASWDQYRSFEERGDMFVQTLHTLR